MKLEVERGALCQIISVASGATKRSPIPILECLHITAKEGRLRVVGTCMDIEAQANCKASVPDPGDAIVNAADLSSIAKSHPTGCVIKMHSKDGRLIIESPGRSATLLMLVDAFPRLKKPDAETEVIDAVAAMEFCEPFASKDQHRLHIAGVHFSGDTAVATNGEYMGIAPITSEVGGETIPTEAIQLIRRTIGSDGRLFIGEHTWRVEAEGIALSGKLIDANYVDWLRVKADGNRVFTANSRALLDAISAAKVGGAQALIFEITDSEVLISGGDFFGRSVSSATAAVPCSNSTACAFALSPSRVEPALKVLPDCMVDFTWSGGAVGVSPSDPTGFHCTLMTRRNVAEKKPVGVAT